jgi:hypothetical protein
MNDAARLLPDPSPRLNAIEGEIGVTLHWDGKRVQRVGLRSTRPLAAARVVLRRRPAEAAALVPTLFAICGHAQGAAATAALRAAGAENVADVSAWTVPLETVQEIAWRLLIDVPSALALPPQPAAVVAARAAVARAIAALRAEPNAPKAALEPAATVLGDLARDHIFGRDAAAWLAATDLAAFDAWRCSAATLPARALARLLAIAPGLGRSDTALMPGFDDDGWRSAVVPALQHDAEFAHSPTWRDAPVETGALARQRHHPLVAALVERDGHSAATRIAARLVELAQLLDVLRGAVDAPVRWVRAWPLDSGAGLAAVQTARGLLLHYARLDDGRVDDYRIVAPTDWNFHPDGALARGLVGTAADDEAILAAHAGLAVRALDPCVGFDVEVTRDA